MYVKKSDVGKYGIKGLKVNQTLYFPIEQHGSKRCLCNYYKKANGLLFKVNKAIDENGAEVVAVTRIKNKGVK